MCVPNQLFWLVYQKMAQSGSCSIKLGADQPVPLLELGVIRCRVSRLKPLLLVCPPSHKKYEYSILESKHSTTTIEALTQMHTYSQNKCMVRIWEPHFAAHKIEIRYKNCVAI